MSTHQSRKHTPVSPSKLKYLELSPAYREDPSIEAHPITLEGTLCHEVLETGNDAALKTDEQRGWVASCREFSDAVLPGATQFDEVKLDVLDGMWGYADRIKIEGDQAALLDWKFGMNLQEDVETNPAAQAYALGLFQKWPSVQKVTVAYLYPRLGQASTGQYTRADIPRIETRIRLVVEKSRGATPETCRPFPETCVRCFHRYSCPTARKAFLPTLTRYAEKHGESLPNIADLETVDNPESMALMLEWAPVFEAVGKSVKRNATLMRVERGIEIPGWELRERSGGKSIPNTLLAAEILRAEGLDEERILRACEFRVPELETVLGEIAPARGKKKKVDATLDKLRDAGLLEDKPASTFMVKSK